ncbi:MAG: PQQ-binding-like beta-propeller repeat protein [Pelagibacteraceae bacterium]|jgi:hypothetical protein|nr:PQQ-binding-like beta-propeller repeat protein [Pelagibacteraceae bacterium]HJO13694.1 hypothetical protein [Alphaproteobacteria bacterium]MBO6467423.1 PQQ-binding-like beta-propeller repeat protein [Pelagibacteraceae bacterium]MBO6470545.1 PQQ-binding-like beta-propeller repeat protein [Pelagibacteraceae bacterium]MBO6470939.1 PQQ-binding-like beta-propeller repeat protein [Pelagibacteraceae bacterium]|tara:strand:+ start:217 stop:1476 length:1260 start_codon:yes stop_codon:yes gene_type:complete
MNLKNIIKLLIIFTPLFFLSCQKLDNFRNKDEIILLTVKDDFENLETFNNISKNYKENYFDHYSKSINFLWKNEQELKKVLTVNNSSVKYPSSNPLNIYIINDKIYGLNNNSDLKIFDLNNKKDIETYHISINSNIEFSHPTSVAMLNNFLYAGYAEGTLIKFDLNGNIIWQLELNNILKTPIKIHNENIIVILSNKILSVDTINEKINWEFIYRSDSPLNVYGGDIVSKNHLLFFYLSNGRLGEIDTIIGENIDSLFSKIQYDHNLLDSSNTLHSFQNLISFYENNKYLYTIDIQNNNFLIEKDKIDNVLSHNFINNALIILDKEKIMKAYNIKNKKIFWKSDLNEYLDKDEKIVEIINNKNRIIIFFNSGLILEIDLISGVVLFNQNIKLKEIISIYFIDNFAFFTQMNGKTTIFEQ